MGEIIPARPAEVAGTYPAPAHHGSEPILYQIEVACVGGPLEIGCEGGHAVPEALPVKAKEEGVLPEVGRPIPAQPRLRGTQEPLDEVASLLGDARVRRWQRQVLLPEGRERGRWWAGSERPGKGRRRAPARLSSRLTL